MVSEIVLVKKLIEKPKCNTSNPIVWEHSRHPQIKPPLRGRMGSAVHVSTTGACLPKVSKQKSVEKLFPLLFYPPPPPPAAARSSRLWHHIAKMLLRQGASIQQLANTSTSPGWVAVGGDDRGVFRGARRGHITIAISAMRVAPERNAKDVLVGAWNGDYRVEGGILAIFVLEKVNYFQIRSNFAIIYSNIFYWNLRIIMLRSNIRTLTLYPVRRSSASLCAMAGYKVGTLVMNIYVPCWLFVNECMMPSIGIMQGPDREACWISTVSNNTIRANSVVSSMAESSRWSDT